MRHSYDKIDLKTCIMVYNIGFDKLVNSKLCLRDAIEASHVQSTKVINVLVDVATHRFIESTQDYISRVSIILLVFRRRTYMGR